MRKRLNVRLLVKLGIALVVLGGGVHALHAVQIDRLAGDFQERGERAAAGNEPEKALRNYGHYLMLRPDDVPAQSRYGIALAHLAATPAAQWRAYNYLEKVISRSPEDAEIRQTLGVLAVKLERYGDAVRHLLPLRGTSVDQADLEQTLAWCYLGAGEQEKAAECLRNAIRARPDRIACYVQLAELRLGLNDADAARDLMDEAVAANAKSAAALVARARFRRQQGNLDEADADLEQATKLSPKDSAIVVERADHARSRDQLDRARALLREGLEDLGRDPRLVLALASLEQDAGRPDVARQLVEDPCTYRVNGDSERLALLVDLLVEAGRATEAERLAPAGPWAHYAKARLAMHQGRWIEAARQLEAVRDKMLQSPAWVIRVDLALAECYRAAGDTLRRIQSARRAVAGDPTLRRARQALARVLFDAGRYAVARQEWEALLQRPEPPAAGHEELARATIAWAQQNPKDKPAWSEMDKLLTAAEKSGKDPLAAALLRADALRIWGQTALADEQLQKAALQFPARPEPQLAQADVAMKRGDSGTALSLIATAQRAVGGRPDARILMAHARLARLGGSEKAAFSKADVATLQAADQQPIWRELIETARQRGDWRETQRLAQGWAARVPFDLEARQVLFELAMQYGNDAQVCQAIADLRCVEGDEGVQWRCADVARLLGPIRRATAAEQKKLLAAARDIVDDVDRLQPDWGRPYLLYAQLDEAEGQFDNALANYRTAFDRGEYTAAGVERLLRLLSERRKFDAADRVLSRYEAAGGMLSASLARLGAEVALELKDGARAVRLARRAVSTDSRDHRDLLWLASVLERAGERADAEAVLTEARARFGNVAAVWETWLRFLVRTGQWDKVAPAMTETEQRLTADRQPLDKLARCYEAAGRIELAEKTYLTALADSPRDPFLNRAVAQFYLFADRPGDAIPYLRNVMASPIAPGEHAAWARRQLATSGFQQMVIDPNGPPLIGEAEALKLLEMNGKAGPIDKRARALVLAVGPGQREEARKLFLQSQSAMPLSADEQFRLAQLNDLLGDDNEGDRLMEELLDNHPENARFLAGQIRRLVKRAEGDAARKLVDRLQKLEPDSPRVRRFRTE